MWTEAKDVLGRCEQDARFDALWSEVESASGLTAKVVRSWSGLPGAPLIHLWLEDNLIMGVAISQRVVHDDPELAFACGRVAIVIPVLLFDEAIRSLSHPITALLRRLKSRDGEDLRITIMQSAESRLSLSLSEAGLRLDSAISVRSTGPAASWCSLRQIRDARRSDLDDIVSMYEAYSRELEVLSPYIEYRTEAIDAVRDRIDTIRSGRTVRDSRVMVAVDTTGSPIGAIEASSQVVEGPLSQLPDGQATALEWLYVNRSFRHGSIARHLVTHAVHEFPTSEYSYAAHLLGAGSSERFWPRLGYARYALTWEISCLIDLN